MKSCELLSKEKNLSLYSFIINILITSLTYGMFLQMHYSVDSYAIIYNNAGQQYLMQGRVISYFLNSILNVLNFNPTLNQKVLTLSLIICIAISMTTLINILYKLFEEKNIEKWIALHIIIFISFLNVFLLEWFLYPEITLFLGIGLVSTVFGIWILSINDRIINIFIGFILLNISMGIYQANLGIFIIYSLAICFIKNKGNLNRTSIVSSIKILSIGALTSIFNILILKILVYSGIAPKSDREPNLGFEIIKNNILGIFEAQKNIWSNTYKFLPKYILIIFVCTIIFITIYLLRKNKLNLKNIIYIISIVLINYLIIFVPHIFTSILWIAQRTIISFFTFISFLCLIALFYSQNNKKTYLLLVSTSVIFLTINFISIQLIGSNHIASNKIDREFSILINNEIEKYEKEYGITIKNIAAECDTQPTYSYQDIKYCIYDTNVRAFVTQWANVNMISYYSNRYYNKVEMDKEIYDEHFKGRNWNDFNIDEQLIFKDDTLYLIIY